MRELKPEALDEWRANPVTEFILGVMQKSLEMHKEDFKDEVYTRGEIDRDTLALLHAREGVIDDLKEMSSDDWNDRADALKS